MNWILDRKTEKPKNRKTIMNSKCKIENNQMTLPVAQINKDVN